MILIGQYDSPFVRRVGIALSLYGLAFEHLPWSVFGDGGRIAAFNPLIRVPVLVLDSGVALGDSHVILDHLDSLVPAGRALFPRLEPQRHLALRIAALATGAAEKAVSLFYEKRLHREISDVWASRCTSQIKGTLAALEEDRARRPGPWWDGEDMGHHDIAMAVALRFIADAHPGLAPPETFPALSRQAAEMEALPVFQAISQAFIPPA
jgi:glutathione S-transferase